MKKPLLLASLLVPACLAFSSPPRALATSYAPVPIYNLVGASDLIVAGTISKVKLETFILDIEEVVRGGATGTSIEVRQNRRDRWEPYASGQRVVVFLDTEGDGYVLRSFGAGAEFPIVEGEVVLNRHPIADQPLPYRLAFATFLSAVREHDSCFHFELDRDARLKIEGIDQVCDADALETYRSRSAFHAHLADMTTRMMRYHNAKRCDVPLDLETATQATVLLREQRIAKDQDWSTAIPVEEVEIRPKGRKYQVFINGEWIWNLSAIYLIGDETLDNLAGLLGCEDFPGPSSAPLRPFSRISGLPEQTASRQPPRVIGIAEIPSLYGTYTGPRAGLGPTGDELRLHVEPSADSATTRWIARAEELLSEGFSHMIQGAVVVERTEGWLRLRTLDGEDGWVPEGESLRFHSLEWLFKWRQAYFSESWDGVLYDMPGAGAPRRRMKTAWYERMTRGDDKIEVEVLESRRIGDVLWVKVGVLNSGPCEATGETRTFAEGWLRVYDAAGEAAVWFHASSC